MKKKLILINSIITVIFLALFFLLSVTVTKDNNYQTAEKEVKRLTAIYANYYKESGKIVKNDEDVRITVIASDGSLIYDSENIDLSTADNHITREEIISAINGEGKVVVRKSQTMKVELMYYAEKVNIGDSYVFVRVALPIDTINNFVIKSVPLTAAIVFFAIGAQLILSVLLSMWVVKPLSSVKDGLQSLNSGNFKHIMPTENDEELNAIIVDINAIGDKLQNLIDELYKERNKLDFILNHITDGVVAFARDGSILLVNKTALSVFNMTDKVLGESYTSLTDNSDILKNISNCVSERVDSVFETELSGKSYLLTLRRTEDEIIILVVADITDRKKNEKTRSDFFANSSHELKTPLTSLKGFNELAIMKESDPIVKEYLLQTQKDIDRMLRLIDDMLNLSLLEHTKPSNLENVDLNSIAVEVIEELAPVVSEKNLSVELSGFGEVFANKNDIYALEKNLIENAVRYTDNGGKISVLIEKNKGVKFTVSDNGIGIDAKDHQRIFERFYRVEKSRSRKLGGTGLGLAIVKHIAERYNSNISLSSKLGVGTTVSVLFTDKK